MEASSFSFILGSLVTSPTEQKFCKLVENFADLTLKFADRRGSRIRQNMHIALVDNQSSHRV